MEEACSSGRTPPADTRRGEIAAGDGGAEMTKVIERISQIQIKPGAPSLTDIEELVKLEHVRAAIARDGEVAGNLAKMLRDFLSEEVEAYRTVDIPSTAGDEVGIARFDDANLAVKILRNCCALGGRNFQDALRRIDLHSLALEAVEVGAMRSTNLLHSKVVLQLLGNYCVQNCENQEALWSRLRDKNLGASLLAKLCQRHPENVDVCAMIQYNCILNNDSRLEDLLQEQWMHHLLDMLSAVNDGSQKVGDFMGLLFYQLFTRSDAAAAALLAEIHSESNHGVYILRDVIDGITRVVASTEQLVFKRKGEGCGQTLLDNLMRVLLDCFSCLSSSGGSDSDGQESLRATGETIESVLLSLRDLFAHESFLKEAPKLEQDNVVDVCIAMLQSLPRLRGNAKQYKTYQGNDMSYSPSTSDAGDGDGHQPVQMMANRLNLPRSSPYVGYRRDVVSVLANLSFRRAWVHQRVHAQSGSILFILEQCQYTDDGNDLMREWGLFAVRNLCEGSEAIQQEINNLKAKGVVNDPKLEAKGITVKLREDGKPELQQRPSPK